MKAGIIGAGRVGSTVAALLSENDVEVSFVTCREDEEAKDIAKRVGGCLHFTFVSDGVVSGVESFLRDLIVERGLFLLFVTVPDDLILGVVEQVAGMRESWEGFVVYHCSGGLGLEVLEEFQKRGADVGVLHPCYPIFERPTKLPDDGSVCFTGSGTKVAVQVAGDLVLRFGGKFIALPEINRSCYHAGNVMAAGHLVVLLRSSFELLCKAGVSEKDASSILSSLTSGVLRNISAGASGDVFQQTLTGPFIRGDKKLIEKHQQAIAQHAPYLLDLYDILGRLTVRSK